MKVLTTVTAGLMVVMNGFAGTSYVSADSRRPVPPFSEWSTAATNIQQAVNAASAGDEIVVTNGIYGAFTADRSLLLRSVNGSQVTIIDPGGQSRCAWLTNGTRLSGFWFRNGSVDASGGAVLCASLNVFLTNCVITGSQVHGNSGSGGGVSGGTLYNCVVASNSAAGNGGGVSSSRLYNCTIAGNHAGEYGGGIYNSGATNCIVYFNMAGQGQGNYHGSFFNYSCTTPMPGGGMGNITNAPQFVNYSTGDLRLLGTSPCIDKGGNLRGLPATDLAGTPRRLRESPEMGAYEFPGTNPLVYYAWAQHHGVLIDGTRDNDDLDGDGLSNFQEWVCYACPTNAAKCLRLDSAVPANGNVMVHWQSSPGVKYFLERRDDAGSGFKVIATNLVFNPGNSVYPDTLAGKGRFFYRLGVSSPYGNVLSPEFGPVTR